MYTPHSVPVLCFLMFGLVRLLFAAILPLSPQPRMVHGISGLFFILIGVGVEYYSYRKAKQSVDRLKSTCDKLRKEPKSGMRDACLEAAESVFRYIDIHMRDHQWLLVKNTCSVGMSTIRGYYEWVEAQPK